MNTYLNLFDKLLAEVPVLETIIRVPAFHYENLLELEIFTLRRDARSLSITNRPRINKGSPCLKTTARCFTFLLSVVQRVENAFFIKPHARLFDGGKKSTHNSHMSGQSLRSQRGPHTDIPEDVTRK